jgi:hypothetical protein
MDAILGFGEPAGASLISPIFTRQAKQVTAPGSPGASTIPLKVTDGPSDQVRRRHPQGPSRKGREKKAAETASPRIRNEAIAVASRASA